MLNDVQRAVLQAVFRMADASDRHLYLVGSKPKDPDEGFSDGEEDDEGSVATAMKRQKSGRSDDEGDLSDVDNDILDEMEGADETDAHDEDEEGNEAARSKESDLDEEEETYRQRFAATKADRDEKVKQLREMMQENARLRALSTIDTDVNEEELARQIQEGIFADISKIEEKDPAKRTKAAYDVVGRHIALSTKKAVELALRQVRTAGEQERQQTTEQAQKFERAAKMGKLVLKEEGLDPEKHFGMLQAEVDKQMEEDPDWFQAIPADQHFTRLISRVKQRIASNRKANDEHRREANGQVNNGSRFNQRQPRDSDDEGDKQKDTLSGAMALSRKANLMRGRRAFSLSRR